DPDQVVVSACGHCILRVPQSSNNNGSAWIATPARTPYARAMPTPTMLWFDYETTGTDPVRDRPSQFAALRTDMALQPVDEPVTLYCAPAADVLPHPEACLITGITPQDAARTGTAEAEFAGRVHEVLAEPGTCSAGYNSIRFD